MTTSEPTIKHKQKNAKTKDEGTKKVINYIKQENNFTKHHLKSVDMLQNKIYKEIIGRIKKDDKK